MEDEKLIIKINHDVVVLTFDNRVDNDSEMNIEFSTPDGENLDAWIDHYQAIEIIKHLKNIFKIDEVKIQEDI